MKTAGTSTRGSGTCRLFCRLHLLGVARRDADVVDIALEQITDVPQCSEQVPQLDLHDHHVVADRERLRSTVVLEVLQDGVEVHGVVLVIQLQCSRTVAVSTAVTVVRGVGGQPDFAIEARPDGNTALHRSSKFDRQYANFRMLTSICQLYPRCLYHY